MNRILLLILSCMAFSVLWSCSDDDAGNVSVVKPVSNVTYESGAGNIHLKWTNPDVEKMSYVEIVYKDVAEKKHRILVNGQENEKLIYGFADETVYSFAISVYDEFGNVSSPVMIDAAAKAPAFNSLLSTIVVTDNFGGVDVSWENMTEDIFYINVIYPDVNGLDVSAELDVTEPGIGKQFVEIKGVLKADVSVSVTDIVGNTSVANVYPFKNLEKGKFDRSIWEVPDFSSQEAGGEGPFPQGYAAALLDGVKTTFWHSKWNGATADLKKFPHYVTFDLKRKVTITKVELTQRHNKVMAKDVEIYGSNESAMGAWTLFQTCTLPQTQGKTAIFTLDVPVQFRYVKMFLKTPGSDPEFGALAEFALYGEDIVE